MAEFNWNHAAYRAEVSASKLPGRAKLLLWWLFDESKRLESAEISVSLAEASAGIWSHCGRRVGVPTVRRALADLVACGIVEVLANPGGASRWILRERKLWDLTADLETPAAEAVEKRIEELKRELAALERKREILLGPTMAPVGQSRIKGGWDVHLSEAEVTAKQSARAVFRKFVVAGFLEDDPESEREFFAFLFTVGSLSRGKKIRSRAGYVAGAVRKGYWRTNINPDHLPAAAGLQAFFDGAAESAELVSA